MISELKTRRNLAVEETREHQKQFNSHQSLQHRDRSTIIRGDEPTTKLFLVHRAHCRPVQAGEPPADKGKISSKQVIQNSLMQTV